MLNILPINGLPEIQAGDDLPALILAGLAAQGEHLVPTDVVVVTSKIMSKAQGAWAMLPDVEPSVEARRLADITHKDPRLVELILRESSDVVRAAPHVLITRHVSGHVMANAGIDASNCGSSDAERVLLLPRDPDVSAQSIADALHAKLGFEVGVVLSDSFGRPWRMGTVNVAIGVAGVAALTDQRGDTDRDGRVLQATQVAVADAIAAAAGLVMGEAGESIPVAIVRGFSCATSPQTGQALLRPIAQDLFR